MDALYLFIALIVSLLINAYQLRVHYKEKEDIFSKFMARNLGESEYFKKAYPGVVKEEKKTMKKERETELTPEEKAAKTAAENL